MFISIFFCYLQHIKHTCLIILTPFHCPLSHRFSLKAMFYIFVWGVWMCSVHCNAFIRFWSFVCTARGFGPLVKHGYEVTTNIWSHVMDISITIREILFAKRDKIVIPLISWWEKLSSNLRRTRLNTVYACRLKSFRSSKTNLVFLCLFV